MKRTSLDSPHVAVATRVTGRSELTVRVRVPGALRDAESISNVFWAAGADGKETGSAGGLAVPGSAGSGDC